MWNLNDYETVEDRLEKYWAKCSNGKIRTQLLEASATRYIVMAEIYRDANDSTPWATGLAEETVSNSGVNKTSALENCESSALGRALANAGFAKRGKRPSQSEMGKVVRLSAEDIKVENPSDPWTTLAKPMPKTSSEAIDTVKAVMSEAEEIPSCKHGPMRLKEGTKGGYTFHGYICPNSGAITDVCEAVWYKIDELTGKWVPKPSKAKS